MLLNLQELAAKLETTRAAYEKVVGETEDYMNVLHSRKKDQSEYEEIIRYLVYARLELICFVVK